MNSNHTSVPKPPSRREEGMALFLVLGLLAVLMIGSGAFLTLVNRTIEQNRTSDRRQSCLNLAEAGVNKALAALRVRPGGYQGEKDTPLGEGLFTVEVIAGPQTGSYRIVSTGFLRDEIRVRAKARVTADVTLTPGGNVQELRWMEGAL